MVRAARECWRTRVRVEAMKIEVVKGVYGHLSLNVRLEHHSVRIAGLKGEGTVIHTFEVDLSNQQTRKVFSDALTLETGGAE